MSQGTLLLLCHMLRWHQLLFNSSADITSSEVTLIIHILKNYTDISLLEATLIIHILTNYTDSSLSEAKSLYRSEVAVTSFIDIYYVTV